MSAQRDTERRPLGDRLRALRTDPPDDGFSLSLHKKLAEAGEPDEPSWWKRALGPLLSQPRVAWPALGAATGLAVVAVLSFMRAPAPPPAPMPIAAALFPATKVAMVRVNLSAEVAVESAQIRISLPQGLSFWADGQELAQGSFEWSQPLSKGANEIPVAVRGHKPGRYRMTVSAVIDGRPIEEEVLLEVVDG